MSNSIKDFKLYLGEMEFRKEAFGEPNFEYATYGSIMYAKKKVEESDVEVRVDYFPYEQTFGVDTLRDGRRLCGFYDIVDYSKNFYTEVVYNDKYGVIESKDSIKCDSLCEDFAMEVINYYMKLYQSPFCFRHFNSDNTKRLLDNVNRGRAERRAEIFEYKFNQ